MFAIDLFGIDFWPIEKSRMFLVRPRLSYYFVLGCLSPSYFGNMCWQKKSKPCGR